MPYQHKLPEIITKRPEDILNALTQLLNIQQENMAEAYAKKIHKMLVEFNNNIDKNLQVGIQSINVGGFLSMYINDVMYSNPSLIIFTGFLENGEPIQVIQHITRICISMITMPLMKPEIPKPLIGFRCADL